VLVVVVLGVGVGVIMVKSGGGWVGLQIVALL